MIQPYLSAGQVLPGQNRLMQVARTHDHKSLKVGDYVIMVETPSYENLLFRPRDGTLHKLQDESDRYVELSATIYLRPYPFD